MYDTAGNLTQWHDKDGGTVTSYDSYPWGQMRNLSRTGFERQYAYTADGQRIVTRDPGTGRLTVTLRGLDTKVRRVVEQHSGQWTWVKEYVARGGLQVGSVDNGGEVRHFYLDHLGSVRQISTGAGHHAAFHTYFPFGEAAAPIEHDGEVMKFTGHERYFNGSNTATMQHLDYMHARYYNPNLARFLTIDPGRDNHPSQPQSWNLYAYTRGNPMKHVDPDGQATLPAAKVVLAGAVVGVAGHVAVGTYLNHKIEGMPLREAFRAAWTGWRGAAAVGALSTLRGDWVATAPAAAGLMDYREQRRRGASTEQAIKHAGGVAFATCVGLLCGKAIGARIGLAFGKTTDGTISGAVAAGAAAEGGANVMEALGVGVPHVIAIPEGSSDNLRDRLEQTQILRDVPSEVDEERRP